MHTRRSARPRPRELNPKGPKDKEQAGKVEMEPAAKKGQADTAPGTKAASKGPKAPIGAPGVPARPPKVSAPLHPKVSALRFTKIALQEVEMLRQLFGLEQLPLSEHVLEFEIADAPPSVPNALRRVLTDELRSSCLAIHGFLNIDASTDPMMFDQFVRGRISLIRLRPQLPEAVIRDVTFGLKFANKTQSPQIVTSGDLVVKTGRSALPGPIFNPTYELAVVQPGHTLEIDEIYIDQGHGREHAAFNVGCRARSIALDIEEYPEEETHGSRSAHRDASGYKVSTLTARPRRHLVDVVIPAAPDDPALLKTLPIDACRNVKSRLALIVSALERWVDIESRPKLLPGATAAALPLAAPGAAQSTGRKASETGEVAFTQVELPGGLTEGILQVRGETVTVGALIEESVVELEPGVDYAACDTPQYEGLIKLIVRHRGDARALLVRAARQAIEWMDAVQQGLFASTPTLATGDGSFKRRQK